MSKIILIVGDYGLMRQSLREWLQNHFPHHRVVDTVQGKAAVALAQDTSPVAVLIDTGWFCREGLESARLLKAALPMVPLIFVSVQCCGVYEDDPVAARESVYVLKQNLHTALLPTLTKLLVDEENQEHTAQIAHRRGEPQQLPGA